MRVLLVDDHPIVRHALRTMLEREPDIEIVGEAADGRGAIQLTHTLHPDVVLMDVSLPGLEGIQATRAIHAALPATCVIGHSTFVRTSGPRLCVTRGRWTMCPRVPRMTSYSS